MTTISNWYTAALQQFAAEAYFEGASIGNSAGSRGFLIDDLSRGNQRIDLINGGLMKLPRSSQEQISSQVLLPANEFAAAWEVVYQTDNDNSGFSATLLKRRGLSGADAEYTIAFRSTEYRDEKTRGGDWQRDVVNADIEISETGFAFGQIRSMRSFWSNLQAGNGVDGMPIQGLSNFATWMAGGGQVDLVGYSLGGHLATVFLERNYPQVRRATIFNSPGRAVLAPGKSVSDVLNYFDAAIANPAGVVVDLQTLPGALQGLRSSAIGTKGARLDCF